MIKRFVLKSTTGTQPPLEIPTRKCYFGRSPETGIRDEFCSRKQVCMRSNLSGEYVLVKPIGVNAAAINGFAMENNKVYHAKHGDQIEIVQDRIFHNIILERYADAAVKVEVVTDSHVKKGMDDTLTSENARVKRPHSPEIDAVELPMMRTVPNVPIRIAVEESKWETKDNGELYIFTSKGVCDRSKIAAYDLDGTLITTVSGNVFPKNIDDWKIIYPEVPAKLKALHMNNYKIVIFTNQGGLSNVKSGRSLDNFKTKLECIIDRLGVPMQAFVATGKGYYRKPNIGMWQTLFESQKKRCPIDKKLSFYVGDAAGRPERKHIKKIKKDHSCADRLMAMNLNITFSTPEKHFQNMKESPWIPPAFDPINFKHPTVVAEPSCTILAKSWPDVVLMVGSPASGKSYFTEKYLAVANYTVASRDNLHSWQKCVEEMKQSLKVRKCVVIDNTNPDVDSRKRFISVAKQFNVAVRCFVMTTTMEQAKHNNLYRDLVGPKHEPLNDLAFATYKKNYKEPELSEGFESIVHINFVPQFQNCADEKVYKMYLCEK